MDKAQELYDELIEKFFVPMPVDDLTVVQERVRETAHRHARIFDRYISTIVDIINTLSLPWNMSYEVLANTSAALVRNAFGIAGPDENGVKGAAFDAAIEKICDKVLSGHLEFLRKLNVHGRFAKSFAAINRQGAVLFYGAVEDFLLTSIEIELEHDSALLQRVAKKNDSRLGSASVPLNVLIESGANCSAAHLVMETIRPRLNNLATITTLCEDVFRREFSDVMKPQQRVGLMLFHLRNLIAHRGGVVDRKFLDDTKTLAPERGFALGEHVSIGHAGLLGFLNFCIWCMVAIGESTGLDARPKSFKGKGGKET